MDYAIQTLREQQLRLEAVEIQTQERLDNARKVYDSPAADNPAVKADFARKIEDEESLLQQIERRQKHLAAGILAIQEKQATIY